MLLSKIAEISDDKERAKEIQQEVQKKRKSAIVLGWKMFHIADKN